MNRMQIIERLVSLKINALNRSNEEAKEITDYNLHQVQASLLESGIDQLIMEIQNTILADYRTGRTAPQ